MTHPMSEHRAKSLLSPREVKLIEGAMEGVAETFQECIAKAIEPFAKRVLELEGRPTLKYEGIWKSDRVYGCGSFVTDNGSVWHAQRATIGDRPGGGGENWVLAVKKGKDAK